jgi:hypothetical protein
MTHIPKSSNQKPDFDVTILSVITAFFLELLKKPCGRFVCRANFDYAELFSIDGLDWLANRMFDDSGNKTTSSGVDSARALHAGGSGRFRQGWITSGFKKI